MSSRRVLVVGDEPHMLRVLEIMPRRLENLFLREEVERGGGNLSGEALPCRGSMN